MMVYLINKIFSSYYLIMLYLLMLKENFSFFGLPSWQNFKTADTFSFKACFYLSNLLMITLGKIITHDQDSGELNENFQQK